MKIKSAKPIRSAVEELGYHIYLFLGSFAVAFSFEVIKQINGQLHTAWIILGILAYTVFAFYFGWFFTSILPRHYKRQAVISYLQRRIIGIATSIRVIIMDLVEKANAGDPNDCNRSLEELTDICSKINPYQSFRSSLERNEPYTDFYEYFSFKASHINQLVEKVMTHSDVLTHDEIQLLLDIESKTNSELTKNIKFSSGGDTAFIPMPYPDILYRLRSDSKALLESVGLSSSMV